MNSIPTISVTGGFLFCSLLATLPATAQVTPDGTTSTTVNSNGNNFEINDGDRAGGNLFHSFRDFSVRNGGEAFFNNANDIVNIFSRVTGGNISNIDGLLRANGGANLFLINPAGIIFGNNARLDIGGSFYGTSADSILFEDGEFSATDLDNPPLLTINAPIGLNFRDNPREIINNSIGDGLQISPGETIALVGGDVTFNSGSIFAPGGNVELGGLSAAGEIEINSNGTLTFPDGVALSDVALENSIRDTSGASAVFVNSGGGGNITVNARNFTLEGSVLFAGINSGLGSPDAVAGDITINATEDVSIDGQGGDSRAFINNSVFDNAIGNAGEINIFARNIFLSNGGGISSFVTGQGNSSDITLNARENILINGSDDSANRFNSSVTSFVDDSGVGNSGATNITAQNLTLTNGGEIQSVVAGVGDSGNINVNVRDSVSVDGEAIFATGTIPSQINSQISFGGRGNSGDINLTSSTLSLTNGGQINVNTFGMGNAGSIDINATESITIDGISTQGGSFSGINSLVLSGAEGNGGNIQITTEDFSIFNNASVDVTTSGIGNGGEINISASNLSLTNGGDINANTRGRDAENIARGNGGNITLNIVDTFSINGTSPTNNPAGIFASNQGNSIGNAGNIDITASQLSLTNGSQINSFSRGIGNAGNITINVADSILLDTGNESEVGALISTDLDVNGVGNGGEININTNNLSLINGAGIQNTTSGEGDAGNTTINVRDSILLSGEDSEGFASRIVSVVDQTAIGNGGTINIITNNLDIFDRASVSARSRGEGNAGNIFIEANSLNLDRDSTILANTAFGTGGNIQLQISDRIFLDNNSTISAEATNNANGGNLNINTNFIVAFPNQNNDIIANANQGNGGNINITAESVFGIEERALNNLTNDINASSARGAQFDGTVAITIPDINAIQTETQVPNNLIESDKTPEQACQSNRVNAAKNGLDILGKGGITPQPIEPLQADNIIIDQKFVANYIPPEIEPIETDNGDIYPARGIIKTADGGIILTAYPTENIPTRTPIIKPNCN